MTRPSAARTGKTAFWAVLVLAVAVSLGLMALPRRKEAGPRGWQGQQSRACALRGLAPSARSWAHDAG